MLCVVEEHVLTSPVVYAVPFPIPLLPVTSVLERFLLRAGLLVAPLVSPLNRGGFAGIPAGGSDKQTGYQC